MYRLCELIKITQTGIHIPLVQSRQLIITHEQFMNKAKGDHKLHVSLKQLFFNMIKCQCMLQIVS